MKVKMFKNGNLHVKAEADDMKGSGSYLEREGLELVMDLCNAYDMDFTIAGDEGCAGNFDMYYPTFNYYNGKLYLPTGRDCRDYMAGKTVKLYAIEPDDETLAEVYHD